VSFEVKAPEAMTAKGGERRIRYYRNPMGLPDTSPTPKKDSMGMDYLPVYEGDEDDDSSVKVSAGKLQKAGVQTEVAERRTLNTVVRAPGIVQEDERRKSVVSLRFEGFIDSVENVTTGSHVHKGQRLMRVYGPNLSSAAAEYLSALNARPDAGISNQALKGARRRLENLDAPEAFITEIERTRDEVKVMLFTARPGIIIGRKGQEVEILQGELERLIGRRINIKIEELSRPEIYAQLVAEDIAEQLSKRASFRRTMKRAMESTREAGARGIKIQLAGRLGGSEMARFETYREGRVPLHTLRADIDFARATANTAYGTCGVKVWMFHGEVLDKAAAAGNPTQSGLTPAVR